MTIQPVVGAYGLHPINDNISKMLAKRCKIQIILKLLTPIIFRVCVWSCIIA